VALRFHAPQIAEYTLTGHKHGQFDNLLATGKVTSSRFKATGRTSICARATPLASSCTRSGSFAPKPGARAATAIRIDDRARSEQADCPVFATCDRVALKPA
jgi:hypothetical protein